MKIDFDTAVKKSHIDIPEWAADAVWYQVFPERFRNGDPNNDPKMHHLKEGGIEEWEIKNWGSDWYEQDEWEKKNYMSVFESIYRRRYGGDLQGIIDKLDYIKSLGVNAIYLNPVFRAPSLHKYDESTHHHVDETFGPDPGGDLEMINNAKETADPAAWVWTKADMLFLELIKKVHEKGMRIILDGVFNHSGIHYFAFQDIVQNGKKSPYKDWYQIEEFDPEAPCGFKYKGWWGLDFMPEFKRDENTLNDGFKQYLFDITDRWMAPFGKPENGIDGWRLDVAFCVPHGFWKEWRKKVKSVKPDAYLTGEIIEADPEFLKGDEFDGVMNYPFAFAVEEFFIDYKHKIPASKFVQKLEDLWSEYPSPVNFIVQNLMSSHDTPRLRTLIVNPDMNYRQWSDHFERTKVENNHVYRIDRGDEIHRQIHKLIAAFQMTYAGAPMIYYGDEIGMTGANDPDCRKPMIWDDIEYEEERIHPVPGKTRPVEKNAADLDLLHFYKKLIQIRNENPPLRRGSFKPVITDDNNDILGFEREYEDEKITVLFNNSNREQTISLPVDSTSIGKYEDLISGRIYDMYEEKQGEETGRNNKIGISAKSVMILKRVNTKEENPDFQR